MACPTDPELHQLLEGALPRSAFEQIEAHIEECSVCKVRLDHLTKEAGDAWLQLSAGTGTLPHSTRKHNELVIPGYELDEIVGSGPHSIVYRARDVTLRRTVAIKIIHGLPTRITVEQLGRFRQEALILAQLSHPSIVTVFDSGEVNGLPYLVTEFVHGQTLAEFIRSNSSTDRESAAILARISRGLAYAHERGIVHRDLKPSNILLANPERPGRELMPTIVDFGLAKVVRSDGDLTHTGAMLGTPAYLAPELYVRGVENADSRSDIYSLGVVAYEMLTGQVPFQGATPYETARLVAAVEPVAPRIIRGSIPRDFETVILKCLEKDPSQRYASAEDVAEEWERATRGDSIHARPVSFITSSIRRFRRSPHAAVPIGISLLILLTSLVFVAVFYDRSNRHRREADDRLDTARKSLKVIVTNQERLIRKSGPPAPEYRADYLELFELHRSLLRDLERDPNGWHECAYSILKLANWIGDSISFDERVQMTSVAVDSLRDLCRRYPAEAEFQHSFGESLIQLSDCVKGESKQEMVYELRREAVQILTKLHRDRPQRDKFEVTLSAFEYSYASILRQLSRHEEAETQYVSSIRHGRSAVSRKPHHAQRRQYYSNAVMQYATFVLSYYRDYERYLELLAIVEAERRAIHKLEPELNEYASGIISGLYPRLLALFHLDRRNELERVTEEAIQEFLTLQRKEPGSFRHFHDLARLYRFRYDVDQLESSKRAESSLTQLKTHLETGRLQFPGNPELELYLVETQVTGVPMNDREFQKESLVAFLSGHQTRPAPFDICQFLLVNALAIAGDHQGAVKQFESLSPQTDFRQQDQSRLHYALSLWQTGQRDRAREYFRELSRTIRQNILSLPSDVFFHASVWHVIEGRSLTEPFFLRQPSRGVPLLFREGE
ncbi:MAG: serine/threonine protein kinase [Gemmataceae bacterium]|nr:serine/threonine protein kinase [Gemmataceae bacterium]